MKSIITTALIFSSTLAFSEGVGIAETEIAADSSAMLEVASTNKGALFPRMTTAQRLAIPTPATGLLVFDTDENGFFYKGDTEWLELATPDETPSIAFHISKPVGGLTPTTGGLQPIIMTSTNSSIDFVKGSCITIDNNYPGFSQSIAYFVAPIDGIYSFQARTLLQGSSSAMALVFMINGGQVEASYTAHSQTWYPFSYSATHKLNAGDKVTVALNGPSGLNIYNTPYTYFSGHLVEPLN